MKVFDLETTGFHGTTDYVTEVAIVTIDESGTVTDRWSSLVRPPIYRADGTSTPTDILTRVTGITWADVITAPTWAEVAPEVIDRLNGEVVIGHNVIRFDLRFLKAALRRAGHRLTVAGAIDTLKRDRMLRPIGGHTLTDACHAWGIPLTGAHRAMADTLATADLATRQAALIGWGWQ